MRRFDSKISDDFFKSFIDNYNKITSREKIAMDIVVDESEDTEWIDNPELQERLGDRLVEMVEMEPDTIKAFYSKLGIPEEKVEEALQTKSDRVIADLIERANKVNHCDCLEDSDEIWLDHDGEFKVSTKKIDKLAGLKRRFEKAKLAFEKYEAKNDQRK